MAISEIVGEKEKVEYPIDLNGNTQEELDIKTKYLLQDFIVQEERPRREPSIADIDY